MGGSHQENETMDDYRTYHVLKLRWGLRECGKCQKARRKSRDKDLENDGRNHHADDNRRKDIQNDNRFRGNL